ALGAEHEASAAEGRRRADDAAKVRWILNIGADHNRRLCWDCSQDILNRNCRFPSPAGQNAAVKMKPNGLHQKVARTDVDWRFGRNTRLVFWSELRLG